MFGSLKVNGEKVVRELSLKEALPGFLIITRNTNPITGGNSSPGDLLLKTEGGSIVHMNNQMVWKCGNNSDYASNVYVNYVDVELNYKAVVE